MNISSLFAGIRNPKRKRVGRGIAGPGGKTAGRGTKGQNSRSGSGRKIQLWFEGGQTPLYRKLPKKRGFNHRDNQVIAITTKTLNKFFETGEIVSPSSLIEKGIIRPLKLNQKIKIIKRGELKKAVKFDGVVLSKSLALSPEN